ncbi:MAG: GNAT family N-acetyltransferase [Chloroflexi bacterium]|nr:GNAT family N-acetyltransferase [Chloroflexota bacterium]
MTVCTALSVRTEDIAAIEAEWREFLPATSANRVFAMPAWDRVWLDCLSHGAEPHLLSVRREGKLVGLAPLMQRGGEITFLGSADVCDYLDFIVATGHEQEVFEAILEHLEGLPWRNMHLESVPGDSPTIAQLLPLARKRGYLADCMDEDVCPRIDLPGDWEAYLTSLTKKDRHELRRKLRRLQADGEVRYYAVDNSDDLGPDLDDFLRLYRLGRTEKVGFLTPEREAFFRRMASAMAELDCLRLRFLEVDGKRVSSVICFDHAGTISLYNSGFDPAYQSLSVGLLLKAMCVREAIASGKKVFDFLRGSEPYKYDLGGRNLTLFTCHITRT